jgi:hypothetical protein
MKTGGEVERVKAGPVLGTRILTGCVEVQDSYYSLQY